MNLLVTLDANYIPPLQVMLKSMFFTNPDAYFDLYVAHSSLSAQDFRKIETATDPSRCTIHSVKLADDLLDGAPVLKRITKETYYRLLAPDYLPKNVDKILYIDPDTLILNPLDDLYNMNLDGFYFAGAGHTEGFIERLNHWRLHMPAATKYINAGVMMMNIKRLRKETTPEEIFSFIAENPKKLHLGDQDVINALYCTMTRIVDENLYNLDEKTYSRLGDNMNLAWVEQNAVIVHYDGKFKPWKPKYKGNMDSLWFKYRDLTLRASKRVSGM